MTHLLINYRKKIKKIFLINFGECLFNTNCYGLKNQCVKSSEQWHWIKHNWNQHRNAFRTTFSVNTWIFSQNFAEKPHSHMYILYNCIFFPSNEYLVLLETSVAHLDSTVLFREQSTIGPQYLQVGLWLSSRPRKEGLARLPMESISGAEWK